jgi:hypothetical protein
MRPRVSRSVGRHGLQGPFRSSSGAAEATSSPRGPMKPDIVSTGLRTGSARSESDHDHDLVRLEALRRRERTAEPHQPHPRAILPGLARPEARERRLRRARAGHRGLGLVPRRRRALGTLPRRSERPALLEQRGRLVPRATWSTGPYRSRARDRSPSDFAAKAASGRPTRWCVGSRRRSGSSSERPRSWPSSSTNGDGSSTEDRGQCRARSLERARRPGSRSSTFARNNCARGPATGSDLLRPLPRQREIQLRSDRFASASSSRTATAKPGSRVGSKDDSSETRKGRRAARTLARPEGPEHPLRRAPGP